METEVVGRWEDLVSRPEFRGHTVRVAIVDVPAAPEDADEWLKGLYELARNGVRITRPADDSRESIY